MRGHCYGKSLNLISILSVQLIGETRKFNLHFCSTYGDSFKTDMFITEESIFIITYLKL